MSEWEQRSLGELMELDVDTVPVDHRSSYEIVGILNRGRGLLDRGVMNGTETSYKTLNRIAAGQVVYSRLKAFEGAITVAPDDLGEAYASQEFPTFTCGPSLLPQYFALITTTQRLWDQLQALSTGMGGRRERVKPADFLSIQTRLPPLGEQRRIVDTVAAVDAQIAALADESEALEAVAWAAAEDALKGYERLVLSPHLEAIEGGRSPMANSDPPGDLEEGVLKVSAVTPYRFRPAEAKTLVPGTVMPKSAEVVAGDVLITRANTPARVGAVCRVPATVRAGLYLSDKTLRLVPKTSVDPDYLVVAMGLRSSRDHLTGSATGTSASMFNISQAKIRSTPIPLPDIETQRRVAATVVAVREVVAGLDEELERLRAFRSALLTALLNQEIEIPDSYDRLLQEVS